MGSMDSSWSGLEVDFGLSEIEEVNRWSLGGVHVESWWTLEMLNKIHLQGIEHATSCIECLYKQQPPLTPTPQGLKYWTNGFLMCSISSNLDNVFKK